MSEGFYLALIAAAGGCFAAVPAIILAVAQLVKIRQLKQEMNGHMTKVLDIQAAGKLAEGELKGRDDEKKEAHTEKLREEVRADAKDEVLIKKIKKDVGADERAEVKIGRKPAAEKEPKKGSK